MYEKLYERNKGLIRYVTRRYWRACKRDRAVSLEDLEQAAFIGLVMADKTYDEASGYNWTTWAAWQIIREIYKALGYRDGKPTKAHTGALALDEPLSADNPDGLTWLDTLDDTTARDMDENVYKSQLRRDVRAAVAALKDERQRQLIEKCDLEGQTQTGAAKALGLSTERVRQIIHAGYKQLRKDKRIEALRDIELRTPYYQRRGVARFRSTRTSDVEYAVIWREEQLAKLDLDKEDRKPAGLEMEDSGPAAGGDPKDE